MKLETGPACCNCMPPPCGGFQYLGGCGPKPNCHPKCCRCNIPPVCQKLGRCHMCPPTGFPIPPLGCCSPCGCNSGFECSTCFPPFRCEPHPCYPASCRPVPKCSEWPVCPCGRPCYRPLGPNKFCYRPKCVPPVPDCPLPKAAPLPCYPKLFTNCRYCPPEPAPPCYFGNPPMIVRDLHCIPRPTCTLPSINIQEAF